jgi:hypothetical protein
MVSAVCMLAWLAFVQSINTVFLSLRPDAIPQSLRADPRIAARNLDWQLLGDPKLVSAKALQDVSRSVLKQEPLEARSLQHFVTGLELAGLKQQSKAAAVMAVADKITRRHEGTHIWFIERSVAANDITSALRRYDIVLRSSERANGLLFERLANAVTDPAVAAPFARYVANNAPWMPEFFIYAIAQKDGPLTLADISDRTRGFQGMETRDHWLPVLMAALAGRNELDRAHRAFRWSKDPDLGALGSLAIDQRNVSPRLGPFAWQALPTPGIDARINVSADGKPGSLTAIVEPRESGIAFQKYVVLAPGVYQLQGRVNAEEQAEGATVRFAVGCSKTPGQPALEIAIGPESFAKVASGTFVVPQDCGAQHVYILVKGATSQHDSLFQIDEMRVTTPKRVEPQKP